MERRRSGVAVVLAGGGARGPYEAGALSVLLPALEAAGQKPTVFVGTSAGAINAVAFASLSHVGGGAAADTVLGLWREVSTRSVFRLPLGAAMSAAGAAVTGKQRSGASALLDTGPLAATLGRVIDWQRLHDNVDRGLVSVGVVATAWSTHRNTVFLQGAPGVATPPADAGRSIDYSRAMLAPEHVMASSALPILFSPVEITGAGAASDWYVDGGLRLNTPIKPALALDVERVVVVATDPLEPRPARIPAGSFPTLAGGAAQVLYAVLTASMVEDLRTLARRNEGCTPDGEPGPDAIRWTFAGPPPGDPDHLSRLVEEVLRGKVGSGRRRRSFLSRLVRRGIGQWAAHDPNRLEALSYLFFDPDFLDGAIRLGQRDARRALDASGAPVWQLTGGSATAGR
jgi:NTE family protein